MDNSSVARTNGPVEFIVAFGRGFKLHRVNSKDKLNNAFLSTINDQEKKRNTSKLPRAKKAPLYTNIDKKTPKPFVCLDNSGDSLAGPSKPKSYLQRTMRHNPQKLKPSHIPRRKAEVSSPIPKHEEITPDTNYFASDTQRVHRLQVPNIPEFHQEENLPTTIRPIPTLGQIYKRNNIVIDGDRFYDWFIELDTPVNSLASTPRNVQRASNDSTDTAQSVINVEANEACFGKTEKPKVVFGANVYKTTNDNINDWLTKDVAYSSKDNESGYRSMSPHSRGAINIESKYSVENVNLTDKNYCLGLAEASEDSEPNEKERAGNENNIGDPFEKPAFEQSGTTATDMPLVDHSTVVISRLPEENETESIQTKQIVNKADKGLEPIVICKSEFNKNLQYPSLMAPDLKQDESKALACSYVECPSEILQKTTNFEGDGLEPSKTVSSLACTDLEIRDDYLSQYHIDNDDCNLLEDNHSAWCFGCRSRSCSTFVKSDESANTTLMNTLDKLDGTKATDSDYQVHRDKRKYCRLCERRYSSVRRGDIRKYCKKHSRYRRYPTNRHRITGPFDSLRRRLSIRRICRLNLNHVWKRTAGKWTNRPRSHSEFGKFRMLEYIKSSIVWDDVYVQTLTLDYREIGTHTHVLQKKSAGISTSLYYQSTFPKKSDTGGTSEKSFKSRFRLGNKGPSMFPFFYSSSGRKFMQSMKKEENISKEVHRFNNYPENRNKFVKAVESRPNNRTTCLCADALPIVNATTSPIHFYKLRTVANNLESTETTKDSNITSTLHHAKMPSEFTPRNVCTQVVLTSNNIETIMSLSPIFKNHSAGNINEDFTFYKLGETSTDSMMILKPNKMEKQSVGLTTSINYNGSTASKPKKKVVINESTSQHTLDDLAAATSRPCLKCTGLKIVSISSAILIPAAVATSDDFTSTSVAGYPVLTKSQACNTNPFFITRSNNIDLSETNSSTGAKSMTKSSPIMMPVAVATSDSSFPNNTGAGPLVFTMNRECNTNPFVARCSNCVCNSRSQRNFTTEPKIVSISSAIMLPAAVVTSLTDFPDTSPRPVETRSTYVMTSVDEISAYTVTQLNNKHTDDFANDSGICPIKRASIATNTSVRSVKQSIGQSLIDDFTKKSLQKSTIETWVQCHILDQNKIYSIKSTGMSGSRLISSQLLNQSAIGKCVSYPPCCDNETDPLPLAFPQKATSVMTSRLLDKVSDTMELQDGQTDPIPSVFTHKSVAVVTSDLHEASDTTKLKDGQTDPIQPGFSQKSMQVMTYGSFDAASDTAELRENLLQGIWCGCARVGCDMETNTLSNIKVVNKQDRGCSTQIFQSHCNQNLEKYRSFEDHRNKTYATSAYNQQRSMSEHLTTLSRLIGHPKSLELTTKASPVLSSKLDAAKWIKRCTNEEKEYQSILDFEQSTLETLKLASLSVANSMKSSKSIKKSFKSYKSKPSVVCSLNTVTNTPPAVGALSDDSLADVLPISNMAKKVSIPIETKKMSDKVTSDETMTKQVQESILQTCPDISHAAVDAGVSNVDYLKSASVLTSKFVLPSPSICSQSNENSECVFVYDKPHCVVHRPRIDAAVSMSVYENNDKTPKSREHAIDQLEDVIPPSTPSYEQSHASKSMVAEVLSPKVYKALYDVTKMVAKESFVENTEIDSVHDVANEAALIRALAIRSAGILTSRCSGLCTSDNCHCNLKADPTMKRAEYVFAYDTPHLSLEDSTQTCSNCHARLLDIPPYFESDFVKKEQSKTQLFGSCRYYSNLLTQLTQLNLLGLMKQTVTKHLAPSTEQCFYFENMPKASRTEACTMKPSGREELGCQTIKNHVPSRHQAESSRPISCFALSPSLTNICGETDRNHLKSVYYTLSAIEGRIRRLKRNIPY